MIQLFNHNQSPRAQTKVEGLTYQDIYSIIRERLEYVDGNFDPDAVCQAICCEIEKKQGIYPNVPRLQGSVKL
jgi:hypothetical protein